MFANLVEYLKILIYGSNQEATNSLIDVNEDMCLSDTEELSDTGSDEIDVSNVDVPKNTIVPEEKKHYLKRELSQQLKKKLIKYDLKSGYESA